MYLLQPSYHCRAHLKLRPCTCILGMKSTFCFPYDSVLIVLSIYRKRKGKKQGALYVFLYWMKAVSLAESHQSPGVGIFARLPCVKSDRLHDPSNKAESGFKFSDTRLRRFTRRLARTAPQPPSNGKELSEQEKMRNRRRLKKIPQEQAEIKGKKAAPRKKLGV